MGSASRGATKSVRGQLLLSAVAIFTFVLSLVTWAVASDSDESDPQHDERRTAEAPQWLRSLMTAPPGVAQASSKRDSEGDAPSRAELDDSKTAFRDLGRAQAAAAAAQEFPELVNRPIDPAPELEEDEEIVGYPTPNAAKLVLPDGTNAVVDSLLPLATTTAEGDQVPVDLAIRQGDGALVPNHPIVPVRLPEQLSEGFEVPSLSLTLTPTDSSGAPLSGTATIEGAVVHYANTQSDTDTIVKPVPLGLQTHSILRSPASPEKLHFQVGVNADGEVSLTQMEDESVAVEANGQLVTVIPPARATDAAGQDVPASLASDGDGLVVEIGHRSTEYQYPIDLDPTVADYNDFEESEGEHNWVYATNASSVFEPEWSTTWDELRVDNGEYPYNRNDYDYGDYAAWFYETQGISRIYKFEADGQQTWDWGGISQSTADAFIAIVGPSGPEDTEWDPPATACAKSGCPSSGGSAGNAALFELITTQDGDNYISAELDSTNVRIAQDVGATITYNTTDPEINGKPNALYEGEGGKPWIQESDEARIEVSAVDPGLGLNYAVTESPGQSSWKLTQNLPGCIGVQCDPTYSVVRSVSSLLDGERDVRTFVSNAAVGSELTTQVKVDNAAPTVDISGLGPDNITGLGSGEIAIEVSDGTESTASSGVKAGATSVLLDGEEILPAGGEGCSPGPCTITRDYSFIGRDLGIGVHTLEVSAVDQTGNEKTTEIPFIVQSGGPAVGMGPGQLNIKNGNFLLSTTDAAESMPGAELAVTRTYESLRSLDEPSPVGPGWNLDFGAWRSVTKVAGEDVVLTDTRGRQVIFEKDGAKYEPPLLYLGWTLSYDEGNDRFTLTGPDKGSTVFRHLSGAPEALYSAWSTKNPDGEVTLFQSASYSQGTVKPSMLSSESCVLPELLEPCKWLSFTYDSSTTATGSGPSEWGDYTGQLSSIKLHAWSMEPGNESLEEDIIAEYAYDDNGRLRATWDPRISPSLKTTYAYDADGHVTAVTPPGQEPWLMRYGSASGSPHTDWLLSAARPPGTSEPKIDEEPVNVELPYLSSRTPIVMTSYSVWNGDWENDPLAYSYQWNRCDAAGENCTPIAGASSQSYVPTSDDVGHRLVASVTAINAGGSVTASTAPTAAVIPGGVYVSSFGGGGSKEGQFGHPNGAARDSEGDIWVVDSGNHRVQEFNQEGEVLGHIGSFGTGPGQFREPTAIAIDSKDRLWVVDVNNNRVQQLNQQGEYLAEVQGEAFYAGGAVSLAVDVADNLWIASNNLRFEQFDDEGVFIKEFKPNLVPWVVPAGIAVGPSGTLWVADNNYSRIIEFNEEGEDLTTFGGFGSGNGQFKSPAGIYVDARGEIWVADRGNDRVQKFNPSGEYIAQFGSSGSGAGQFDLGYQAGLIVGPGGAVWITDSYNDRVQRWLSLPTVQSSSFGSNGSEPGEFKQPYDLATAGNGNVWVADSFSHRLQQFSPEGEFLSQFGESGSEEGQLSLPVGVTVDPDGDLWVANFWNHHVQEFSPAGELLTEFGEVGEEPGQLKNPTRIAVDSEGDVWVADSGNNRVQKFSPSGEYLGGFGEEGSSDGQFLFPAGIAVDSDGNLWVADRDNHRVQKFDPEGEYLARFGEEGAEPGQLKVPTDVSIDADGSIWVVDTNNHRIQQFSPEGEYLSHFGEEGSGGYQLTYPNGLSFGPDGRVWVADRGNDRVSEWQRVEANPEQSAPPPNPGTATWTAVYDVPISGSGAPQDMSESAVAKWGQSAAPAEAAAIFPPDQIPSSEPTSYKRATVYYTNEAGWIVNTLAPGGRISTEEHDQFGNVTRTLTPENRQRALDAGKWQSAAVSEQLDTQLTYSEDGSRLTSVLGPKREVELESGEAAEARPITRYFYDEGAPEQGGPYDLVTKQTEGALVGEEEHDVRTRTFGYNGQEGLGWELGEPTAETTDPGGLDLTTTTLYDPDTGDVVETRMPANPEGGNASATQAIYYETGESEVEGCGERPELAGLICQTRPAAQPETAGLPDLPVTTTEYNVYGQPTVTTEVVGEAVRTATIEYDAAGRPTSTSISATSGKSLPSVHTFYDEETGLPTVQSTETESIVSEYDSLGRLISYTDADENASTFAYDILGRPTEVYDGKGTQTFSYDETTGDLAQVADSAAGTFSAEYDAGGKVTSMAYPNGLEARYTYDSGGGATGLEYVDTTECGEECTWFEDEAMPSIHGETLSQTSSLADLDYAYDAAGRLVEAEETPQGDGCTTRLYAYDANTNRTGMTTRAPAEGGACAGSGGETQTNAFDEADRLLGEGIAYDDFGNVTELPGAYAGGKDLLSTYYADDSAASLTQDGVTIEYMLDPAGREREALTEDGEGESSLVSHFSGESDSPAWTEDGSGNWTRYIGGMGGLTAIQSSTEGLDLQITDLSGDIVATAAPEEAEGLDFIGKATEYGEPQGEGPPAKYSWLGSAQRPVELDSGVVNMGARTYVPQLGRFLQEDPIPGGSANAYAYVHGDPVGESDPSGEYTPPSEAPSWLTEVMENPPGMPPPPPPPSAETEALEEATWSGIGGGKMEFLGSQLHIGGKIGKIVRQLKAFISGHIEIAWNTCIPRSELRFSTRVLTQIFGSTCIPKIRRYIDTPYEAGAAKLMGWTWCVLVNSLGRTGQMPISVAIAALTSGAFCSGNGGDRPWAYVKWSRIRLPR